MERAFGLVLPDFDETRTESENWGELVPAERRVDLALTLRKKGAPLLGVLFESQRQIDERKKCTWHSYLASFHATLNLPRFESTQAQVLPPCPVYLVVFTESDSVAEWARRPTETLPGNNYAPLVLTIPKFTTVEEAKKNPELAVFSVTLHVNKDEDLHLARVALEALAESRDEETVQVYTDVLLSLLSEAHRKTLEAEMNTGTYVYKSDFAKKYIAQGKAEGKAEGEKIGEAKGEAKGKAAGEALGKAEAVLVVLQARKLALTPTQKATVLACTDLTQLDAWLSLVASIKKASDLFPKQTKKTK